MAPIFVILGAGASYACASGVMPHHPVWRPPLVPDLFGPRQAAVLREYPIVQMAAAEIRKAGREAVALEHFLRTRFRDSSDELDRRKFVATPYYLQHLLHSVSDQYTEDPDNYNLLLGGLLRLPEVVFVTLNYDTILDDRLNHITPITSMDSYILGSERWSLIKLHGSVNWGRKVTAGDANPYKPTLDPKLVNHEIELRLYPELHNIRVDPTSRERFYPALSVPVGEEDELVCPEKHVNFVRDRLRGATLLHLLVIGYSGLDREVISLVRESGTPLESLWVVNADQGSANEVWGRIQTAISGAAGTKGGSYDGDFNSFVQEGGLGDYLGYLEQHYGIKAA